MKKKPKEIFALFFPSCPFQSLSCKIRLTATLRHQQQSAGRVTSPWSTGEGRVPGIQAEEQPVWTEPCDVRCLTSLLELFEDITALLDKRNSRDVLYLEFQNTLGISVDQSRMVQAASRNRRRKREKIWNLLGGKKKKAKYAETNSTRLLS